MRILDIQNLQLSHNNFYININDLNLENDVWHTETSINLYFNFSYKVPQQATHNLNCDLQSINVGCSNFSVRFLITRTDIWMRN